MDIYLLAIESSCDDTSAAVLRNDKVLANLVASQAVHEQHGGIVPELASRAHMQNIVPVVDEALKQAGVKKEQLHAIAFTRGPGLIGSLLVGGMFSKAMTLALKIPLIEVNHMQAHVLAHFIKEASPQPSPKERERHPVFPFLCLTVSGGHTQIVLVRDYLEMEVVGETNDDAAGEAFDKSAKLLGFPYPGGPLIDKHAQFGNPKAFKFGEPVVEGLDFSFSGLKTSILYFLQKKEKEDKDFIQKNRNDLCASIQEAIINILMKKLTKAAKQFAIKEIAIAGGVSANSGLRKALEEGGKKHGWNVYIPPFEYCTDNAAMIGIVGYYKYLKKDFALQGINPVARYAIGD
ncbi:MAG: tRNA (adenosine(37)-N6)-threonylcarbamoyltransferase complex transferase subunit TsaD [Chitinophagales bacterium]|nr:tRNA (adenosine(37)-N6)-threonylcarbamoyltransferase complex transferase subunit TsaD [Chitinophagales bacterium]